MKSTKMLAKPVLYALKNVRWMPLRESAELYMRFNRKNVYPAETVMMFVPSALSCVFQGKTEHDRERKEAATSSSPIRLKGEMV